MHFEVLVEDSSGKDFLELIIPKIIGSKDTFNVISYKGIGRIPQGLKSSSDPKKRIFLNQLPRLLNGYGKSFQHYDGVVVVIPDLDSRCFSTFRDELLGVLNKCHSKPTVKFCIAIEEGEAWMLGDISAVVSAYPKAKRKILQSYDNDSICGTWEVLADAVYPGGASVLKSSGWQVVGKEKSEWAKNIPPYMNVEKNSSPSFCYLRDKLREVLD